MNVLLKVRFMQKVYLGKCYSLLHPLAPISPPNTVLPVFIFVKISRYMFAFHVLFFLTEKRFLAHCFHHFTLLLGNHSI